MVCPLPFLLLLFFYLFTLLPFLKLRVDSLITSRWSVGLRQISCSFKPPAAESPGLIRVDSSSSCSSSKRLQV